MSAANSSKIDVDLKLKERLKMFEEIDKMVKLDKLNPSNTELKEELSNLDNSSLYNYSEKCFSKANETEEKNFNFPMQTNKYKKNQIQEKPLSNQKQNNSNINIDSESDKCFSKYISNSNYIESTYELRSFLPTPDNESIYKREKEKAAINNIKDNKNLNVFEEKNNLDSNFNLYKKNKVSNKRLPLNSSKSPQRKSDKLSDFDNNDYDFPQQISKKETREYTKDKSFVANNVCLTKNNNKKINENEKVNNYKNKNYGVTNFSSNQIENIFQNNICNDLNLNTEINAKAKSDNNIKKSYDSNKNQGKNLSKNSLSTYENTCNITNVKANNIKKEVKKDFVECFDYDFHNFPLIKNIPDSKIYETEQHIKKQEINSNIIYSNNKQNLNNFDNNQFNYNTLNHKEITNFINKNYSNKLNRNLTDFLNTNKSNKNNLNSNLKNEISKNKSSNKSFERSKSKISNNKSHSRSRSRSISDIDKINNNPDNKRLKSLKKCIMNSKDANFGERLYNYNFYLNEKLKNKLKEEDKQRLRSMTPKITRKAKNLKRDDKNFHLRLYPYSNNNLVNYQDANLNNSADIANSIHHNFEQKTNRKNDKFTTIYDNFNEDASDFNIVYDKNFINKGLFCEENSLNLKSNKRSHSSNNLLTDNYHLQNKFKVNNYNNNIFNKKNSQDENINFTPKLNKKSLDIASRFGPAIDRLYPKEAKRNKRLNNSNLNTPKSYFSNFSEINRRSISPLSNNYVLCNNNNNNSKYKRNNSNNNKEAIKRQHDLYKNGLEKMKKREEISKEKLQIEKEHYKQFSYRPKINSKFTSNIINRIYKTPTNSNSTNKNIKDETLKFDLSENNLIGSPISNANSNFEQLNFNDLSGNTNNCDKTNSNSVEKFKHIYEKNLLWKKKLMNQAEKIKTSEEQKIKKNMTFKPHINKNEMKNDEKFIEKNLEQINDYVNKRRLNLKKQKEEEEFKQRKLNFGQNFVIKPTIPQEFNLRTAKKKSENKNNFNKSSLNNISYISNYSNNINVSELNKSPLKKLSNNNNNNNDFNYSNAVNVNSIRNELKIHNFFSDETNLDFNEHKDNDNCFGNHNLFYENNNHQLNNNQNINNLPNKYYSNDKIQNNFDNRKNNYNHISSSNNQRKNYSTEKTNIKFFNKHSMNKFDVQDNSFFNSEVNSNKVNKNDLTNHIYDESQKGQMDFVNAINNLHEKLVNLNI